MKEPKTIKGYILMMRRIEKIPCSLLKGYDKLPHSDQNELSGLSGSIGNHINEVKSFKE